jgi:hypothetical protein
LTRPCLPPLRFAAATPEMAAALAELHAEAIRMAAAQAPLVCFEMLP